MRRQTRVGFVGGPLNRRKATTLNAAKYCDADGLPLDYRRGYSLIRGNQLLGSIARIYCLDEDHTTYRWLPDWIVEIRGNQIQELLEQKAEHPERADEIEEKIQHLERLSADHAESAA